MKIQSTDQTTFKWNTITHIGMTLQAVKNSKLSPDEQRQLVKYAIMPDFLKSEAGYSHNTHFYFPYGRNKSFGAGANTKNNALERFKVHFQKALSTHEKEDFLKHTGFAVHYLEDVTMPMHTEPGCLMQKIRDFYLHQNFEIGTKYGATPAIKTLMKGFKSQAINYNSLVDLFTSAAEFSQKPEFQVSRFNKQNWRKIQQKCFNYGVNATREFLEKMLRVAGF